MAADKYNNKLWLQFGFAHHWYTTHIGLLRRTSCQCAL